MTNEHKDGENSSIFRRAVDFLLSNRDLLIIVSVVVFSLATGIISLVNVDLTPATELGESVEKVLPATYWASIAIMIIAICFMLQREDTERLRIPFLLSCAMLLFSIKSVLAIFSPFPPVVDTWGGIYATLSWQKYGIFSPQGMAFFRSGYIRAWPASYILAYLITSSGIPVYSFYLWAPSTISILNLVVIYFLFKELASEKIGMVSAFLFTLLNTTSVFTLHYCAQGVGALFYLVAMYVIVKAYKTRKLKHLALAFLSIFAVVLTHHMTTFFLGISLAGAYFTKVFLGLWQDKKGRWFSFTVESDTFIKFSPLLSVFTFALWYFYGFIVYRSDAIWMLAEIVRLLTTHQPLYQAGYYHYFIIQSPVSQLSVLMFPAFIVGTATVFLLSKILKKEPLEGYLWLTMGSAGALFLTFVLGNMIYGNYIDPSRSRELMALTLFPASASFLLEIFDSRSPYKKGLVTVVLIIVAFLGVFSIYRGAQHHIYFNPPWWMRIFNPP